MEWPGRDDLASIVVLALAGIVTAITGLWRGWFGAAKDVRANRHAVTVAGTYEEMLAGARRQIVFLGSQLDAANNRIEELRAALDTAHATIQAMQKTLETLRERCDAMAGGATGE